MSAASVYIITGASRGLGEALALRLLKPENRLICIARSHSAELQREAEAAGVRLDWFERDLAELAGQDAAEALMQEMLGALDLNGAMRLRLINNAGVLEPIGPAHTNPPEAVAKHIAVNLTAPMTLTAAFLRLTAALTADKRILQVSSGAGRNPYAGWSAYCASKAGLDHFSRCIKLEQDALPNGAKIASVAPGVIDTSMQASIRQAGEDRLPTHARFVQLHEAGGLTLPLEAAGHLLRLLEDPEYGKDPVMDIRDWVQA